MALSQEPWGELPLTVLGGGVSGELLLGVQASACLHMKLGFQAVLPGRGKVNSKLFHLVVLLGAGLPEERHPHSSTLRILKIKHLNMNSFF